VGVHIDEAGRDDLAADVDLLPAAAGHHADGGNAVSAQRDVAGPCGGAAAIDEAAAAQHEVKFLGGQRLGEAGREEEQRSRGARAKGEGGAEHAGNVGFLPPAVDAGRAGGRFAFAGARRPVYSIRRAVALLR
jgi:hypothetical protein